MTALSNQITSQLLSQGDSSSGIVFCADDSRASTHYQHTISNFIEELAKLVKVKPIAKSASPSYWSKAEVSHLVVLMRIHGSDFTTIATKMRKTRDQIKRKFKVLERRCPELANAIFEKAEMETAHSGQD